LLLLNIVKMLIVLGEAHNSQTAVESYEIL